MENNNTVSAEDVLAFMKSSAAELAVKTGERYSLVQVSYNNNGEIEWKTYCAAGTWTDGKTLEDAVEKQIVETGPKARARRIRAEAEALLKTAQELESAA